jgi:hypothetical protein
MSNDRRVTPTWKWFAGIFLTIIFALGTTISGIASYSYIDTQEKIEKLDRDKVDAKLFLMLYDDFQKMHRLQEEGNKMLVSHIIESGKGKIHDNELRSSH